MNESAQTYQVIITTKARTNEYLVATSLEGPVAGKGHIVPFAREHLIRVLRESGLPEMAPERVMPQLDDRRLMLLSRIPAVIAELFQHRE